MSNYDSILKTKNTYKEDVVNIENKKKKFPWFRIDFICIILLLVVSYFIYYNNVLTPDNIFLNDLKTIYDKYSIIVDNSNVKYFINNNYNLKGNLDFNDEVYNINLNKFQDKLKIRFGINEEYLNYQIDDNEAYLNVSNFNDIYYKESTDNYLSMYYNVIDYLQNRLPKSKFIKKFYLNGTIPVVESNLVLNTDNIKDALGVGELKNTYEILFTFKNNAISNKIISMKVIVNNSTTGRRGVFIYENGILTYTENDIVYKFVIENNNKDFRLDIYKNDTLYSVLTGNNKDKSYEYLYQVIDKVYNISLIVNKEDSIPTYQLSSNINVDNERRTDNLNISLEGNKDIIEDNSLDIKKEDYNNLDEIEMIEHKEKKYNVIKNIIDYFKLLSLRKFI